MKKNLNLRMIVMLLLILASFQQVTQAQLKVETQEQKAQRMSWWTDARFGMFIH